MARVSLWTLVTTKRPGPRTGELNSLSSRNKLLKNRGINFSLVCGLLLGLILFSAAAAQTKKTYELMYEDIQALKLQVQELSTLLKRIRPTCRNSKARSNSWKPYKKNPDRTGFAERRFSQHSAAISAPEQQAGRGPVPDSHPERYPPGRPEPDSSGQAGRKDGKDARAQAAKGKPQPAELGKPAVVNIPPRKCTTTLMAII